jgi:transcription termination factor Rho
MLLPELKAMANQMGISGASGMRKGDLVAAIADRQGGGNRSSRSTEQQSQPAQASQPASASEEAPREAR